MEIKKKEENKKLILKMQKPFSTQDILLFILKIDYPALFYFLTFTFGCFVSPYLDYPFYSFLFILIMLIWSLNHLFKTYYIYQIEFDPLSKVLSIYTNYPLLRINAKQEFQIKKIKIGKVQYGRGKSEGIIIVSIDNQIKKIPVFNYKYSLKKEKVNNFINKINQYL